jgi:hypothetical protein
MDSRLSNKSHPTASRGNQYGNQDVHQDVNISRVSLDLDQSQQAWIDNNNSRRNSRNNNERDGHSTAHSNSARNNTTGGGYYKMDKLSTTDQRNRWGKTRRNSGIHDTFGEKKVGQRLLQRL